MTNDRNRAGAREGSRLRDHILDVASALFYRRGVRAVGVDLVVAEAGVAKTSLYRHFGTKDHLVAAFLEREDRDFWSRWDGVAERYGDDPYAELRAHLDWIGERVGRRGYRGCPQLNVAAEFPDADHPARRVAVAHKREMRRRLHALAERLGAQRPEELAGQLSLVVNGAFVSSHVLEPGKVVPLLRRTADALIAAGPRQDGDASTVPQAGPAP